MAISIPIYDGSPGAITGSTPFGLYDNDTQFQSEGPKIADWIARRLGYPVADIELQSGSFYAAFEEAITEYSAQVNQFNIRENMMNVMGASTGSSFTGKEIATTFNKIIAISSEYGTEAGTGGNVMWKSGSINVSSSIQRYDLNRLVRDITEPGEIIEIKQLYYEAPPSIIRYFDPLAGTGMGSQQLLEQFGFGNYSPGVSFLMMPMYADLLRLQAIEFNDQFRRSQFSFELINNQLRIFPIPTNDFKLHFRYIRRSDRANPLRSSTSVSGVGKISDYSNVPYTNIQYRYINDVGKQWIRMYALALTKEMLGWVRSKYSTIPIPGSEITLNGTDLLTQSANDKEKLITILRETLEETGRSKQMEKSKDQSNHLQEQLTKMPLKIYIG